jgi:hypothetical protein
VSVHKESITIADFISNERSVIMGDAYRHDLVVLWSSIRNCITTRCSPREKNNSGVH